MSTNESSLAVRHISPHVWKLPGEGNCYFVDGDKKIIIDTGARGNRPKLEMFLSKIIDFSKVELVIFTHAHLDHVGNFDAFPNAQLTMSRKELEDLKQNPYGAVLDERLAKNLLQKTIIPIEELDLPDFEIIDTPGHTAGSISLWFAKDKVLFSGDTLFPKGIGRTDLPTSVPDKMQDSLNKLTQYNFKVLAAGHDYGLNQQE